MRPLVWMSWYICIMFGLLTLLTAAISMVPEQEPSRNVMMLSFACDALVAAGVAGYLSWLPRAHWVHQSRGLRVGFIVLSLIVSVLVVTSFG